MEPHVDHFFADRLGRTWDITLTMAGALRIDNSDFSAITEKKFSVVNPDREFFTQVLADSRLILAMIWAVVQPQVEAQGISASDPQKAELDFLAGFDGQTIRLARETFWRAVADFFPDHQGELMLILRQYQKAQEQIGEALKGIETEVEAEFKRFVTEEVQKTKASLPGILAEEMRAGERSAV